jgi:ethanolamine ammonia-lyase small subunit
MRHLRDFTMARVGLGKAGDALPTHVLLELRRARAAAGDAVHEALDVASLVQECEGRAWPCIAVRSAARNRAEYLRRPDLGRTLDENSRGAINPGPFDVSIIVADGLSALAVHRHAFAVLDRLIPKLRDAVWTLAPLTLVEQGRVAIGDDIATFLKARLSLILIGERPGLTSPDSLGAYLTWSPARGKTDAERNCISNIRPEGMPYDQAADRLFALIAESRRRRLSGVALKEDQVFIEAGHLKTQKKCSMSRPEVTSG